MKPKPKPDQIDILQIELDQKLPHWLSPGQRDPERLAQIRARNRAQWIAEQKQRSKSRSKAMPIKPGKDESQNDWMHRCVPEMMGENGGTKRPQDQAVAACLSMWRDAHPSAPPPPKGGKADKPEGDYGDVEYADPGYQEDKKPRYPLDTEDHIRAAWSYINMPKNQEPYTADQVSKIKARIIAAWKRKIDAAGPPSAQDDGKSNRARRRQNSDDLDPPDPEDDESREDYLDRCVEELSSGDGDVEEDDAREACQIAWEEFRAARGVHHKTHADGDVHGMEFCLSDETIDRMGDVISSAGWDLESFNKNPIALFNHRSDFPVGRWDNLRVEDKALRGKLVLAPKGTSERIDEIRKLVEAGILRAVSVGFREIASEGRRDAEGKWVGYHFLKQELVETSLVSVPANPNALAIAKSLKISPQTIDLVFSAKHGNRGAISRRGFTGKHAETSRGNRKGNAMSGTLAQRIIDLEAQLVEKRDALQAHLSDIDDSNVSDAEMQMTKDLNVEITRLENQRAVLIDSEKALGQSADNGGGNGTPRSRSVVTFNPAARAGGDGDGTVTTRGRQKKELGSIDYLIRAATVAYFTKTTGRLATDVREKIYGDDELTRLACDLVLRAASAPAMTTVTGWAAELVHQIYTDFLDLLLPKAILARLATRGLTLNFGQSGRIIIPTRQRTPTLAGSFVGEGMAIPVRQGAFTSQTLTPKKVAVISTWTREMNDHSIPAIEGLLREAVQADTTIAIDTVLIDANPATVIRPAGLLNGVAGLTPTAGGGLAALTGDLKLLIQALAAGTYGNIREPVWLMNPADILAASLTSAPNTGIFPFRDEIKQGTLNTIPFIDSVTVPQHEQILIDAADFVVVGGEAPRLEISDQATLHMEDSTPQDLVTGSPGVVATPQKSLFQTDSLALRMIMPLNWVQRRAGTVAWVSGTTWS